jgi:hypothetical protein
VTNEARVPHAGEVLGHFDFSITQETLGNYLAGLDLEAPSVPAQTAFGSPAAPSMLVHLADDGARRGSGFSNSFGTLWVRQRWALHGPMLIGEPLRATGRIVEVYPYRDRTVVLSEASLRNEAGELLAVGQHHQSYLLDQTAGEVRLRDPKEKRGGYPVPDGDELAPIERTVTLEMCQRLFPGATSYHTDRDAAAKLGFKNIVVGGRVTLYYMGEVLERHFGRAWWEGGELEVKFTNVVWPEDRITARGVVTGIEDGRHQVEVWVEKADGTVVTVAQATVPA